VLKFDGKENLTAAWEQNNQLYTVWFDPGGQIWWATGKIRNTNYFRKGGDGATTCPQSEFVDGSHPSPICYSPLNNIVVIWQGAYQFDNSGVVYGGPNEIYGHITKLGK
jgi:hypothetical protein